MTEEKMLSEMQKELKIINEMNDFDKEHTVTDILLLGKDNSIERIKVRENE